MQNGHSHPTRLACRSRARGDKNSSAERRARDELQPRGKVHVFMSVPVGVAMMMGQSLNTIGPVQTYEHLPIDAVGIYRPAAPIVPKL